MSANDCSTAKVMSHGQGLQHSKGWVGQIHVQQAQATIFPVGNASGHAVSIQLKVWIWPTLREGGVWDGLGPVDERSCRPHWQHKYPRHTSKHRNRLPPPGAAACVQPTRTIQAPGRGCGRSGRQCAPAAWCEGLGAGGWQGVGEEVEVGCVDEAMGEWVVWVSAGSKPVGCVHNHSWSRGAQGANRGLKTRRRPQTCAVVCVHHRSWSRGARGSSRGRPASSSCMDRAPAPPTPSLIECQHGGGTWARAASTVQAPFPAFPPPHCSLPLLGARHAMPCHAMPWALHAFPCKAKERHQCWNA